MFYHRHISRGRKSVKAILYEWLLIFLILIAFEPAFAQTAAPPAPAAQPQQPAVPPPTPAEEREKAVNLAREGKYDDALDILKRLNQQNKDDPDIARDYVAVLSWSGHDQEAVDLYATLPAEQPDYVLAAIGHSYRQLHQTDKALAAYRLGLKDYPDNVVFAEGEIRCLADAGNIDEALARASDYASHHPAAPEIDAVKTELTRDKDEDEHAKLVGLARHGHYKEALALLHDLETRHPGDAGIVRDKIAVLDWSGGHDAQVISLYKSLPEGDEPDYVLESVGHAYRNLNKPEQALAIYRRGLKQSPDSDVFAVGVIRSLTDEGQIDPALAEAESNLKRYGNRFGVLLAAGDAADQHNPYDALRYYEAAARLAPKQKDALQGIVRNAARIGAPQPALDIADTHAGLIPDEDYRRLQGDQAAALVRWGVLEPESEETRYAATDRALEHLDDLVAGWSEEGSAPAPDIMRARFDRILALRNRARSQDAVDEYIRLIGEGVTPPDYLLGAVGDAHLTLRHPEQARNFFLQVLEKQPHDVDAQHQLYYAYNESFDYDNAYRTADGLVSDQPIWFRLRGESSPVPNYERDAEFLAGEARIATGEVADADEIIVPPATAGPATASGRAALGDLYMAHGWPRQALEQYQIGLALNDGKDVKNEMGIATADLDLQQFPEAEASAENLIQRFPENTNVQHVDREWEVHDMAEIDVKAQYDFNPLTDGNAGSSVNGGEGYDVDTTFYSQPIDYNWRIFAGEYFAHQAEPSDEGAVSLSSSRAGVEYRDGPVVASLAPTFNHYHDSERFGGMANVQTALGDQWTLNGGGELFAAHETPLRALNAGVTADYYNAGATWRQDEAREVQVNGSVMPFSDGNFRSEVDTAFMQRLWTDPYIKLDGLAELSESQNTDNENRDYYNPARDILGLFGLRAAQTLYQRYSTLYQHSLTITPGFYWQHGYGNDAALRMRYEQELFLNDVFELGWNVDFQRQSYDGAPENDVSTMLNLMRRF